jgi:repressor LexA
MTPAQKKALTFIKDFWEDNGYAPSYRDIMAGLSLKSVSQAAAVVDRLVERGYITKMPNRARSIRIANY